MILIKLPSYLTRHWQDAFVEMLYGIKQEPLEIDCGDWLLTCSDFKILKDLALDNECEITFIHSKVPETVVSGKSLGLNIKLETNFKVIDTKKNRFINNKKGLIFHHGTLRSGDQLESQGDVLLLGDVNPGAKICAAGNVLVWGRLRGVAHAGTEGRNSSKIVALQLRPLQLRIADVVARGPEEKPQIGLIEQASLIDGEIVIEPAPAQTFTTPW